MTITTSLNSKVTSINISIQQKQRSLIEHAAVLDKTVFHLNADAWAKFNTTLVLIHHLPAIRTCEF